MSMEFIWAIIRHILAAIGTSLATNGYLSESQGQGFGGAILAVIMLGWSIYQKATQQKEVDVALQLPPNTSREQLAKELKLR